MIVIEIVDKVYAVAFTPDEIVAIRRYAEKHDMLERDVMKAAVESGLRKFGYRA